MNRWIIGTVLQYCVLVLYRLRVVLFSLSLPAVRFHFSLLHVHPAPAPALASASAPALLHVALAFTLALLHVAPALASATGETDSESISESFHFLHRSFSPRGWQLLQRQQKKHQSVGEWVAGTAKDALFQTPCRASDFFQNYMCRTSLHELQTPYVWVSSETASHANRNRHHRIDSSNSTSAKLKKTVHYNLLGSKKNSALAVTCKAMKGRDIMFIGDSMQEEFQQTLLSALMKDVLVPVRHANDTTYINQARRRHVDQCYIDPKIERIEVKGNKRSKHTRPLSKEWLRGPVRTEILCGDHPSFWVHLERNFFYFPDQYDQWRNTIKKFNISLMIINSATTPDDTVAHNLNETLRVLFKEFPFMSVIYRNSVPGHVECQNNFTSPPLSTPQTIDIYEKIMNVSTDSAPNSPNKKIPERPKHHTEPYGWFTLAKQNNDVEHMLALAFPRVLQMDIYTSTVLRIDSHKITNRGYHQSKQSPDCLHYCIPGPVDQWVTFLVDIFNHVAHVHSPLQDSNAINGTATSDSIFDDHIVLPSVDPLIRDENFEDYKTYYNSILV